MDEIKIYDDILVFVEKMIKNNKMEKSIFTNNYYELFFKNRLNNIFNLQFICEEYTTYIEIKNLGYGYIDIKMITEDTLYRRYKETLCKDIYTLDKFKVTKHIIDMLNFHFNVNKINIIVR